jgi:hypothetical protein
MATPIRCPDRARIVRSRKNVHSFVALLRTGAEMETSTTGSARCSLKYARSHTLSGGVGYSRVKFMKSPFNATMLAAAIWGT